MKLHVDHETALSFALNSLLTFSHARLILRVLSHLLKRAVLCGCLYSGSAFKRSSDSTVLLIGVFAVQRKRCHSPCVVLFGHWLCVLCASPAHLLRLHEYVQNRVSRVLLLLLTRFPHFSYFVPAQSFSNGPVDESFSKRERGFEEDVSLFVSVFRSWFCVG